MASSVIGYVVFLGAALVMAVALLFGLRAVKLI
jgi:Cytochrome B6-F complex subunit VI (PetL)